MVDAGKDDKKPDTDTPPYPVGMISRVLCRYPIAVMLVSFLLSAAFSSMTFAVGSFEVSRGNDKT